MPRIRLSPGGIILFLLLLSTAAFRTLHADSTSVRRLHDAVLHMRMVRAAGPWVINVAVIDMRHPDIEVRTGRAMDLARGRETTSAMAARMDDSLWQVLVAVNGDFFTLDGETIGNAVVEGQWARAAVPERPAPGEPEILRTHFAVTETGSPLLDRFRFAGWFLPRERDPLPVVSINTEGTGGAVLYNEFTGVFAPPDSNAAGRRDIPLELAGTSGDTVVFVAAGSGVPGGFTAIPPGGVVVRLAGEDTARVRRGDTVRAVCTFIPRSGKIRTMVGGMPRLVLGGQPVSAEQQQLEGPSPSFIANRHPRTGVGFTSDSTILYLVTVDGRQEASAGMSLAEFTRVLVGLGVSEGVNLDGGGSTTMVVEGRVANSPSDAMGERPVANCILVRTRRR